jgi:hypothetical protein
VFNALRLLLLLVLLLAGAPDVWANAPENRVWENFGTGPETALAKELQAVKAQQEIWVLIYDPASGSTVWTKFDPEGLSMWTAAYKIVKNGGNIAGALEGATGHFNKALESDNFLGAAGHTWAALSEVLPVSVSDVEGMIDSGKSAIQAGQATA